MKNYPLAATVLAILIIQFLKYPISRIFMKKTETKLSIIHTTGGMPSSHTAAVTALITALSLQEGFASPYVAIAAAYGLIVMFDAMGVRRQSGEQGVALREILDLLEAKALEKKDPLLEEKLQQLAKKDLIIDDYLGHKPSEVFGGLLTGVLIALLSRYVFYFLGWVF